MSVATLVVPVSVGAADKTTEPVPVEVVVPVPPSDTASVVVRLSVAILTVPVSVGAADKTTEPVPVEVVVPVPPLVTASAVVRLSLVAKTLVVVTAFDAYRLFPSERLDRFETCQTLRFPTFAVVAKTFVVVTEFETTRFANG
jgi:hypothetical protein